MSKNLNDFRTWFDDYSDEQLIDRFNEEVGKPGWSSSRAEFAGAMIHAFEKRSFDASAILSSGVLSRRNRVMLVDNRVIIDPIEQLLNPFQSYNPSLLNYPLKATGTLELPGEDAGPINVDLALSAIEIFQNISGIRKVADFKGMILCFNNPLIGYYCMLIARFDYKALYVKEASAGEYRISYVADYPFNAETKGLNVNLMHGFSHIILLPGSTTEVDKGLIGARLTGNLTNKKFVISKG
ncbi:hypothetical protein [Desertivirga arenae]|uniref:hypothetical protein n=1 Tax=Desertivirga arenae TaxID=2810309 RepID=UPI001A97B5FD|nr:hypothetical protein [Pedobacter sp. SYSU D00823]